MSEFDELRRSAARGDAATAGRLALTLRDQLPRGYANLSVLNELVDTLIGAGRYADAEHTLARVSETALQLASRRDPGRYALVHVNLAEADYCRGNFEQAERRLLSVAVAAGHDRLALAGLLCQRAWLASLQGEPAHALELLEAEGLEGLPERYWAELHYTRALAYLKLGDPQRATRLSTLGLAFARRPSSVRNGQFLLGRLALATDDREAAHAHFEAGIQHFKLRQGGDALLEYALASTPSLLEYRRRLQLVLEFDPESAAACAAQAKLWAVETV